MPVKAILFDIDGTLVDSNDLHVRAWIEAFAAHGHRFTPEQVRPEIGKGGDMLVPALIPGVSDQEQEALSEAHGKVFQSKYLDQVKPFPGAHDLLKRVHEAGLKVALASSAQKKELDHYVELLDVKPYLDATTTTDDVENSKPAPDITATAVKKLGLGPGETLFIGDTPYDIESGGKAGVATIGLLSGGFPREELNGAVAVYDDAAALLEAFPEWVS